MTDFAVIGRFRNVENVRKLAEAIRLKGATCYTFADWPADPDHPTADPDTQMHRLEHVQDTSDSYFQSVFARDLEGIKKAKVVVMLLPGGASVHVEIGIAYGLGKKCILVGQSEKQETLYEIFQEKYSTVEDFLSSCTELNTYEKIRKRQSS